jgi:hypothetical protein
MTGFCTNSGLKFLISADSSIHHPPLDDIKILSLGIELRNSDSTLTSWRKGVDNIGGIL